jgi:hypothetical protein
MWESKADKEQHSERMNLALRLGSSACFGGAPFHPRTCLTRARDGRRTARSRWHFAHKIAKNHNLIINEQQQ